MNEKIYEEQLKRKDQEIKELKEQNEILIRTNIKKSKEIEELKQQLLSKN